MTPPGDGTLTLLLCGDVMLGRGIDQVLAHPGDPTLREAYVRDARDYVGLAEATSGPVPWPVDDDWPWGDALADLGSPEAVRILNLETSITRCGDFAPGKAVSYRMNPDNLGCLVAARPDVCVLANNHVLDFGRRGLAETLDVLASAGLASAGAGRHLRQAQAPAVVERDGARVAVIALAHPSSGVPRSWAAGPDRSGVDLLPDLTDATAARVGRRVEAEKRLGSVVVVSVHWGPNWGFDVPRDQVSFAHRLVDAGADVVHGHSSHHPRPLEVHAGRLVIHGCGDFVNDYEGIAGHEELRGDLRLLHRVSLAPDGALRSAHLVPYRARRLRLERARPDDVRWLEEALDRTSRALGVRVRRTPEGRLALVWDPEPLK
ncbi:MAG TPA: CapA family protein [Lapillicoccus sp.]|nr:CapA family protein [Lapillicoccus sp.]